MKLKKYVRSALIMVTSLISSTSYSHGREYSCDEMLANTYSEFKALYPASVITQIPSNKILIKDNLFWFCGDGERLNTKKRCKIYKKDSVFLKLYDPIPLHEKYITVRLINECKVLLAVEIVKKVKAN